MQRNKNEKPQLLFVVSIVISAIAITVIGLVGKFTVYKDYDINLKEQPVFTAMFEGIHDGIYPWAIITGDTDNEQMYAQNTEDEYFEDMIDDDDTESEEHLSLAHDNKENQQSVQKMLRHAKKKAGSDGYAVKVEAKKKTKKKKPKIKITKVKKSYFDDALFIGDSRTVGLSEYSDLKNASYCADVGLSVYTVFDKKIGKIGKKKVTLEQMLKSGKFTKIYIMLGINELGTGTPKTFAKKYGEVIQKIRKYQPDAYIIIQEIMNVGQKLSSQDKIFNNKNIGNRNKELKKLADNKKIFYLEINEAVTDKKGYIPSEYSADGIHLKAKYYELWNDYLLSHGIVEK